MLLPATFLLYSLQYTKSQSYLSRSRFFPFVKSNELANDFNLTFWNEDDYDYDDDYDDDDDDNHHHPHY